MRLTESSQEHADTVPPAPPDAGSGRDAAGRFLPGHQVGLASRFTSDNWGALQHALRSDRWPEALTVLRDEVEEFTRASLVDEGDVADVPTRRLALLGYRARLHRRIVQLDAALELRGLIDRKGKLRVAWLQQFAALVEKARALDVTLGLERRQRSVGSPLDYINGRVDA